MDAKEEKMEKVKKILAEVLEIPYEDISEETSMESCASWTSLALVTILDRLETEFDTEFDVQEAIEMDSVKAIKEILEEKGII